MKLLNSCLSLLCLLSPWVVVSGEEAGSSTPLRLRKLQATVPANDECTAATFVNGSSVLAGTVMEGSTVGATLDSISCEWEERTAVYYKFVASGARYRVTTCHEATDYDSALYISNENCDNFGCSDLANNNDFDCDEQGMGATVEFYSEPESFYTVAVMGTTVEGAGNYGVSIQEFVMPENNQCVDATVIEPSNDGEILLTGSTTNATYNSFPCEVGDKLAVYYKFLGTGGPILLSTCSNETNFNSALALFEDNCDGCPIETNDHDFDCDELGMGSSIEFLSKEDVFYVLAVRGVAETDKGEFGLTVHERIRPSNDVCTEAIRLEPASEEGAAEEEEGLEMPIASSKQLSDANNMTDDMSSVYTTTVAYGSTSNTTKSSFRCLVQDFAAVFYTVVGTGQLMRVSTCTREVELDFDSVIQVYEGLCNPDPIACSNSFSNEHDFACEYSPTGFASTVEWETEPDVIYSIALRGLDGEQRGDFGLSLEAFGNATEAGSTCRWVQVCD